jgi:hypothetical protein
MNNKGDFTDTYREKLTAFIEEERAENNILFNTK